MPFSSIEQAKKARFPTKINGVPLALGQVNKLSGWYDKIKAAGSADEPMAVAISMFQREYRKSGGRWVLREAASMRQHDITEWSAATINALPDKAFLYVEEGEKDDEGKTTPRSLRHLHYEDANGNVSLVHLRNAISGAPHTKNKDGTALSDKLVEEIQTKARKILDEYREEYEGDDKIEIYESQDSQVGEWTETFDAECPVIEAFEDEPLTEGGDKVKKLRVTLLREGFSLNVHKKTRRKDYYRYYPAKTLEDAITLFEDLPLYVGDIGHDGPATMRDRVGPQERCWLEDVNGHKEVKADYKVYPDNNWLYERAKIDPLAFGPSIEGAGAFSTGEVAGKPAAIITKLAEVARARLVEKPAAGGRTEIIESEGGSKVVDKLTLDELREDHPDLVAQVEETAVNAYKLKQDDADKDDQIKALTEENASLEKKVKDTETIVAEAASVELIEAAFPEDLPDITKAKLTEELKGETDEKKIKEAVEAAVKYIADIAESKGFKAAGTPAKQGSTDAEKANVEEAQKNCDDLLGVKEEKTEETQEV